jgi:hypothetical protein
VGAGVLRGLALAFVGARSGTELGIGGVGELAGWRHGEGPFFVDSGSGAILAGVPVGWRWGEAKLWRGGEIGGGGGW